MVSNHRGTGMVEDGEHGLRTTNLKNLCFMLFKIRKSLRSSFVQQCKFMLASSCFSQLYNK